ncbi:MAG: serine acetyltransferase [Deltaproteobacteria bacterium]
MSLALESLVDDVLASYRREPRATHMNCRYLPSRDEIIAIVQSLFEVFYPGYFGRQDLDEENLRFHLGTQLSTLRIKLVHQIRQCLGFDAERTAGSAAGLDIAALSARAMELADSLLSKLPAIRDALVADIQAAYDGDPAAGSLDEIVLAYPGLLAITVYRVAHELNTMEVPLMPRIMSEWAHSQSGADIHPGARIGRSFFIDHATGVVVGETSDIGDSVKLYQGVTLGALSHPKDDRGRVIRNSKRHPTVEAGVTVYANATVLGGETVVGEGAVIGGSVFLTRSVPRAAKVATKPPELRVVHAGATRPDPALDFEI